VTIVSWGSARLEDDEVHPHGERRDSAAVREPAGSPDGGTGPPQSKELAAVDRLLRQAEVAAAAKTDLDHHEPGRWPRIDSHDVELGTADVDVAPEDVPAMSGELSRNALLRPVTP
jgi:hypothetical protein